MILDGAFFFMELILKTCLVYAFMNQSDKWCIESFENQISKAVIPQQCFILALRYFTWINFTFTHLMNIDDIWYAGKYAFVGI